MDAENTLSLLASLLGNSINENKAQVCINNAVSAIREYINKDNINIEELYPFQVAQLAYFYYKSFDDAHIDSKSQGGRSVSLSKDIPDYIKRTLPRYVKPF